VKHTTISSRNPRVGREQVREFESNSLSEYWGGIQTYDGLAET